VGDVFPFSNECRTTRRADVGNSSLPFFPFSEAPFSPPLFLFFLRRKKGKRGDDCLTFSPPFPFPSHQSPPRSPPPFSFLGMKRKGLMYCRDSGSLPSLCNTQFGASFSFFLFSPSFSRACFSGRDMLRTPFAYPPQSLPPFFFFRASSKSLPFFPFCLLVVDEGRIRFMCGVEKALFLRLFTLPRLSFPFFLFPPLNSLEN